MTQTTAANQQENLPDNAPEQSFVRTQMRIATKALNELADEYMACADILEDTSDLPPEDAAKFQIRMAAVERYFRRIGSNIRRYAEV